MAGHRNDVVSPLGDFRGRSCGQAEQTRARPLIEHLPENSLVILDRGFVNAPLFAHIAQSGNQRHFLVRSKSSPFMSCSGNVLS